DKAIGTFPRATRNDRIKLRFCLSRRRSCATLGGNPFVEPRCFMAKEFRFPDLGEGIAEGELVKWLVKEGDTVEEDQDVAEVETDKALVNIPSPYAGKVEKLHF